MDNNNESYKKNVYRKKTNSVDSMKNTEDLDKTMKEKKEKEYETYVKEITPTHCLPIQMAKAFLVGGAICVLGQVILELLLNQGIDEKAAGSWCSLILIGISVILTGFNIYPSITKWGGAGSLVPITGFANSVAAPAIEFKEEGQVYGVGSKIFSIAGSVILYGIFVTWVLGIVYYVLMNMGVIV